MEYAWYELDGKVKDLVATSHKVAEPTVPIASDEADLTQDEDMVLALLVEFLRAFKAVLVDLSDCD